MNKDSFEKIDAASKGCQRNVSPKMKKKLHELLIEYSKKLREGNAICIPSVQAEVYSYHVNQVLTRCQYFFTMNDIYQNVEIWCKTYTYDILSILQKVFGDIV